MTGSPALTRTHRTVSGNGCGCRPGIGAVNVPPPTSSSLPARVARSARLNTLIVRQGGEHVLYGSVLTLGAATQTWAELTDTMVTGLALTIIR